MRLLEYPPPNISVQTVDEVNSYTSRLVDGLIHELTTSDDETAYGNQNLDWKSKDIVFKGDLGEVNEFFLQKRWSDGLPIIPPTIEAVEAMLKSAGRRPDEVIGTLVPGNRQATVWAIAVNGVMAGCRPEYMPLLIALVKAIAEPRFGLEHAGSTLGWTPLIILNGPIVKELDFNYGQGVFRPQKQANVSVSRFLRLCMMNIADYRLGETDMATFGRNYMPVLAENQYDSPWPPLSVDLGFAPSDNVVTVLSCGDMGLHYISVGNAEEHLQGLVNETIRVLGSQLVAILPRFGPEVHPVICLTPLVASILEKAGYNKKRIRMHLFEKARITAEQMDMHLSRQSQSVKSELSIKESVKLGKLPPDFGVSDDPRRLVPVVHNPDEFYIVVTGMPSRNRSCVIAQVGDQGLAVSKKIG
ncbi:MAG: hypothetical protein HYX87_04260 [Chloroflexi bacterium]|nr:hypothetical protein [Chloroflexota bacterium]